MKYYCEDAAEVLRQVESSEQGLTGAEAQDTPLGLKLTINAALDSVTFTL